MNPAILDMTVQRGSTLDARFTVSADVTFTDAELKLLAADGLTVVRTLSPTELVTTGQAIDVILPGLVTEAVVDGGAVLYQLDLMVDGMAQRFARGRLVSVPGVRSAFT